MRICHISNHPYEYDSERDGCACTARYDDYEMPKVPLVGIVPGASKDTAEVRWRRNFGPGLDAYKGATDNGLQPDEPTLGGVEQAEKRAYLEDAHS